MLLSYVLELVRSNVLLTPLGIEPVLRVILTWCRLFCQCLCREFVNDTTRRLTSKNVFACTQMLINVHWMVLAYAWHLLLEVDVDGYRLDVVKRVVLVER